MTGNRGIVQVAGVSDPEEALMLAECGVDWIGLPLRLAHHRPDLEEAEAAAVIASLPAQVAPVLITYLDQADQIVDFAGQLGVVRVQLHGSVPGQELDKLRRLDPNLLVIKSLVIREDNRPELVRDMEAAGPFVDWFITDTFDPATGACGATGKIHDWEVSRSLVAGSRKPVILAGGLNPGNVRAAIERVRPAGVDAHSGLEDSRGRKDRALVQAFVAEARAAFSNLSREFM